ncbi:MAG TPA: hypothetical protein VGO78_20230, partial [Acidimicrobiales bacterium]|nr:hypothetical protein [Acidimicrobiales bacterium]
MPRPEATCSGVAPDDPDDPAGAFSTPSWPSSPARQLAPVTAPLSPSPLSPFRTRSTARRQHSGWLASSDSTWAMGRSPRSVGGVRPLAVELPTGVGAGAGAPA